MRPGSRQPMSIDPNAALGEPGAPSVWRRCYQGCNPGPIDWGQGIFLSAAAWRRRLSAVGFRRYSVGKTGITPRWADQGHARGPGLSCCLSRSATDRGLLLRRLRQRRARSAAPGERNAGSCEAGYAQAALGPRRAIRLGSRGSSRTNGVGHASGHQGDRRGGGCDPKGKTGMRTHDCAFRRSRPLVPTHRDHLFRTIATSMARGMRAPSGASADFSVLVWRQA